MTIRELIGEVDAQIGEAHAIRPWRGQYVLLRKDDLLSVYGALRSALCQLEELQAASTNRRPLLADSRSHRGSR